MKRLAFCFDGTWNRIDGRDPTNVARIAQSVSRLDKKGRPQLTNRFALMSAFHPRPTAQERSASTIE